jgi:hypothetical protein
MQFDENPFEHTLQSSPEVSALWPMLTLIAICLFPIEIFVRRVVVPLRVVLVPLQYALSALPGLRRWIRKPAPLSAPPTGAYMTGPARERVYEAAPESAEQGFGTVVDPAASKAATPAADAPETTAAPPAPPAPEETGLTRQLLDAKERALERKTRRIDKK